MGRPKKEENLGPEACCHPAAPLLPNASLSSQPPEKETIRRPGQPQHMHMYARIAICAPPRLRSPPPLLPR